MTAAETSAVPLVFDPYDYDFHEDPYPYYRRLRDEAPLYRNDDLKFWALSRHHDVLQGFRNSEALSNANGVSMDKASFGPFRQRDEARTGLVALVQEIINGRVQRSADSPTDKSQRDMLDVLIMIKDEHGNPRFTADEITGMFISMMFAGHHTSSGTASWVLIELLRHPDIQSQVIDELDELYADGSEVSFHALRQIPKLENVLKETLRLHPPLIILMRVAKGEFEVGGFPIHDGDMVAASPAVSNRIAEDFPNPDGFVPDRYEKPRQEDIVNRWTWIPFGAGRHRCVGAAFATMQIKAIFSVLLREYEFEMAQPADSYHNDHSKMVVQLAQPAKVRYRKRSA